MQHFRFCGSHVADLFTLNFISSYLSHLRGVACMAREGGGRLGDERYLVVGPGRGRVKGPDHDPHVSCTPVEVDLLMFVSSKTVYEDVRIL